MIVQKFKVLRPIMIGMPVEGVILDNSGVIPRSVQHIFRHLDECSSDYNVKVSHLEIYNESMVDLLGNSDSERLRLVPDERNGTNVMNLEEVVVHSAAEIFTVLSRGQERRRVAETKCNKYSSRSHCIFTITIHMKDYKYDISGYLCLLY